MVYRHRSRGALTGRLYDLYIYPAGETTVDLDSWVDLPYDALEVKGYEFGGYDKITVGAPSMPKIDVTWNFNAISGGEYIELREALFYPEKYMPSQNNTVQDLRVGTVYAYRAGGITDGHGYLHYFIQTETVWEKYNSKEHTGTAEAVDARFFMLSNFGMASMGGFDEAATQNYYSLMLWDSVDRLISPTAAAEIETTDGGRKYLCHRAPDKYYWVWARKRQIEGVLKGVFNLRFQKIVRRTVECNIDFPDTIYYQQTYTTAMLRGAQLTDLYDESTIFYPSDTIEFAEGTGGTYPFETEEWVLGWVLQGSSNIRDEGTVLVGGFLCGADKNSILKKAASNSFWDFFKDASESALQKMELGGSSYRPAPVLGGGDKWVILDPKNLNYELGSSQGRIKKATFNVTSKTDEDINKIDTLDNSNRNSSSFSIPETMNNLPVATRYERDTSDNPAGRSCIGNKLRSNNIYYRHQWQETLEDSMFRADERCNQVLCVRVGDMATYTMTVDKLLSANNIDTTPNALYYSETGKLQTSIVENQTKTGQPFIFANALKLLYNRSDLFELKITDMPITMLNDYTKALNGETYAPYMYDSGVRPTCELSGYRFYINMGEVSPRNDKYWLFLGDLSFDPRKETVSFKLISLPEDLYLNTEYYDNGF